MDITKFLNNRLGQKVLAYWFVHEDEAFYVRELAELLDEDPGNLSRVLGMGLKIGIFSETEKGRVKYFQLNKKYHSYQEIKGLFEKTVGASQRLKQAIGKFSDIDRAFIYGSFARGDISSDSDIDVCLVGKPDENELLVEFKKLEKTFGREINYVLLSPNDYEFRRKSDSFLEGIVSGPKISLK